MNKDLKDFKFIPTMNFKYVLKHKNKNIVMFSNELVGANWSLLNIEYDKDVNNYQDIMLLHDLYE